MPRRTVTITPANIHFYRTGSFNSSRLIWKCPRIDRQVLSNFGRLRRLVIVEPLELNGLEGIEVCSKLSYLNICEPCDIRPISALTSLVTLIVTSTTMTIRPILNCTKLRTLDINFQTGMRVPLTGIENLRELRHLTACLNAPIAFSTLAVLTKLAYINVNYCGDLAPMPSLLSLLVDQAEEGNHSVLEQLKVLPQLRALECSCSILDNLDQLQHMTRLERLIISGNVNIKNIHAVRSFPRLKNFTCWCESIGSISSIKHCHLLRTFDCSGGRLTDLKGLGQCIDLRRVNIWYIDGLVEPYSLSIKELASCHKIKEFDGQYVELHDADVISNWTSIENLCIGDTGLTNIDFLTNCPNLTSLNLSNDQVSTIDHLQAPKLRTLFMSRTNITTVPFERYPQLVSMYVDDCPIRNWPDIRHCQNLRGLYATHCGLRTMDPFKSVSTLSVSSALRSPSSLISPDHIPLPNIQYLKVSSNRLDVFPFENYPRLTSLHVSHNNLASIEGIALCPQLHTLNVDHNQITNFSSICCMRNIQSLSFNDNPLAPQDPRTARVLARFTQRAKTASNIYTDTQNVHDFRIQMSVNNSVRNLLKDPVVTFNPQSIIESDLPAETITTIIDYCSCDAVHSTHDLTYAELFAYVWDRIQRHEARSELYKILADQIRDSECKCFTGRFNRTLSVLVGFYDDISINISDSSRISAIIIAIRNRLDFYAPAAHRDAATQALIEAGYSLTDIKPWLNAIED